MKTAKAKLQSKFVVVTGHHTGGIPWEGTQVSQRQVPYRQVSHTRQEGIPKESIPRSGIVYEGGPEQIISQ